MSRILRIAPQIAMEELRVLAASDKPVTVVLGNLEQPVPTYGLTTRQVVASRLLNLALACARQKSHDEVRISGDAAIANAVFGDKSIRRRQATWFLSDTDATRIQAGVKDLEVSAVDRILVTSQEAKTFLARRLPLGTTIDLLGVESGRSEQPLKAAPARLSWIGSGDPNDGLHDFLRIAALLDLPTRVVWTAAPPPSVFTAAVASISMLGLEHRVTFAMLGSFRAFVEEADQSEAQAELWVCTARDAPERSAHELLAASGAPLLCFDSMYARNLERRYPGRIELVPEGDVLVAVRKVETMTGAEAG